MVRKSSELSTRKGRTELRPAFLHPANLIAPLERKLRTQLHRTRPARADRGVGGGYIRSSATATERTHGRIIQPEPVLTAVRVGEVRVIEDVEELGAELKPHGFSKVEILSQREIEIPEAAVLEHVAAHVAELAERRRNHHGTAIGVAAKP